MHHQQHHGGSAPQQQERPTFPLAMAGESEVVSVARLPRGGKVRERLLSMGIAVNDQITVVQKQHGGAIMVEKNGTRYVLGGGMAHKIQVVKH